MKPLFGIDITENKDNDVSNGDEFITARISKQMSEEFEGKQEKLEETIENSKLPLFLRIGKTVCGFLALIVALVMLRHSLEKGVNEAFGMAFKNAPGLIIVAFLCFVTWAVLTVVSKKKERTVLDEENADEQAEELDEDADVIYESLGVPSDASSVDVLIFRYKLKNGVVVPRGVALSATPYINVNMKLYASEDSIHLADLETVHSIKKAEIVGIRTVHKRISIMLWNKDEEPNKGRFKQYKMTVDNYGSVHFKPYYVLEFEHGGELWGVYIPCYELETFEAATGIKAE